MKQKTKSAYIVKKTTFRAPLNSELGKVLNYLGEKELVQFRDIVEKTLIAVFLPLAMKDMANSEELITIANNSIYTLKGYIATISQIVLKGEVENSDIELIREKSNHKIDNTKKNGAIPPDSFEQNLDLFDELYQ